MSPVILARACPSLALIKYWGKRAHGRNLPATPSLAVTLGGVHTETRVAEAQADAVSVDGVAQDMERFAPFFDALRRKLGTALHFRAESANSFPTASGLASSSSGFAALAAACTRLAGRELPGWELSALARIGSASAARSVFGGFTLLPAGARFARQLHPDGHWPELRIVVAVTSVEAKELSSREAMESTRAGSPYYGSWLHSAGRLLPEALGALARRDLDALGQAMRLSYARMHAALLASDPPVLYWLPDSVAVIRACAELRRRGVGAWETVDAGPQVKILCLEADVPAVLASLEAAAPAVRTILCRPGPGAETREE